MAMNVKIRILLMATMLATVFSTVIDGDKDCAMVQRKCPDEMQNTGPICGNDGRNYRHLCHLYRRKCKMDLQMLKMGYEGKCKTQEEKECPKKCPSGTKDSKVCGSDGRTYTTTCAVTRRKCRVDPDLSVAYTGRCMEDYIKKGKTPKEPKYMPTPEGQRQTVEVETEVVDVKSEEVITEVQEDEEVIVEIIETGTTVIPDFN